MQLHQAYLGHLMHTIVFGVQEARSRSTTAGRLTIILKYTKSIHAQLQLTSSRHLPPLLSASKLRLQLLRKHQPFFHHV